MVIYPHDNAIDCLNKQGLGEEKVGQNFLSKETIQYKGVGLERKTSCISLHKRI